MKKILGLILVMGMMFGLINTVYAYQSSVTVNSDLNGCKNYDYCGISTLYAPLPAIFFEANLYTFAVDSGGYASNNFPYNDYSESEFPPVDLWFWSVNIFDRDDPLDINVQLGSTQSFSSLSNLQNHSFSPVEIDLRSGGRWLQFYAKDEIPRNNDGLMTMAVTTPVVPEPISSILFLVGGSTLAARRFMRRKKIDRQ